MAARCAISSMSTDAVKAFAAAMQKLEREPVGHDVVNIPAPAGPTSVQDLADTIAALFDY